MINIDSWDYTVNGKFDYDDVIKILILIFILSLTPNIVHSSMFSDQVIHKYS